MAVDYKVHNVDLKILEILMQDAKKPHTEVAKKAFVSGGTVQVRMKKLEEANCRKNDPKSQLCQVYDITAFIGIFLEKECFIRPSHGEVEGNSRDHQYSLYDGEL